MANGSWPQPWDAGGPVRVDLLMDSRRPISLNTAEVLLTSADGVPLEYAPAVLATDLLGATLVSTGRSRGSTWTSLRTLSGRRVELLGEDTRGGAPPSLSSRVGPRIVRRHCWRPRWAGASCGP